MKLNFIEDKVINLETNDLLGTKPYVESLQTIISSCNTPFTLGLFGGWGIGKSSIIKTLKDNNNDNINSKISIFTYDAWKYSNDSFRRTFLYELKKEYELDTSDDFNRFYEDKHEDIGTKIGIFKYWWIYLIIPALTIFFINIIPIIEGKEFEWTTFGISIFISGIITFISKSFVQYKISVTRPKTFAPEQFEEIFIDAVNEITNEQNKPKKWIKGLLNRKKKIDKLVVVIDNIDRCHKDLAFKLLLNVKNFLEQKNVIFIIPIDENEIKKHIKKIGHDANEFLRKLFNTSISIKEISENDLFDFAKTLNNDYELELPIEIVSIISHEFSKNPRKIIQFLNVLQTEMLLSNLQEESKAIPKGSISDNLPFLTKILIIREEWPDIYSKIASAPYWLNDLQKELTNNISDIEIPVDLTNFLRRTEHIIPNHTNFELFFINKDSFRDIPDGVNKLVESRDINTLKKQIHKKTISFDKLIEFIDYKFEIAQKRGEIKTTIVNIISLFFQLSNDKSLKKEMNKYLYGNSKFTGGIKYFINSISIKDILLFIDEKVIIQFIKENEKITNGLKTSVIEIINTKKTDNKLLIQYLRDFKTSPIEYKKISKTFNSHIIDDLNFFDEIKDILDSPEIIEHLINSSLVDEFIEQIENKIDDESIVSKIKILTHYNTVKGLTEIQTDKYIRKIISYIDSVNDYRKLSFWLMQIKPLIKNLKDDDLITAIFESFKTKQQWFWDTYDSSWENNDYQQSLTTLLDNIKLLYFCGGTGDQRTEIINWFINFISKNESQELILYINNIFKQIINYYVAWDWPFSEIIINKINEVEDWEVQKEIATTLNLMLSKTMVGGLKDEIIQKGLTDEQIKTIFRKYLDLISDNNKSEIIDWLILTLKNKILIEQFETIVNELSLNERLEIIDVIKQLSNEDLMENMIVESFEEAESEELNEIFEKLQIAEIKKNIINKSVKNILKNIKEEDENFEYFIEFAAQNPIADKVIYNIIAGKIKHLLVSNEKDEIMFALRIIDFIDISDNRKIRAIKTLIQDIEKDLFNKEELKIYTTVKRKLIIRRKKSVLS